MKKITYNSLRILIGILIISLVVGIAFRIKKTKEDYHDYSQFIFEKIYFYSTYFQVLPDSINDIQKFIKQPSDDIWHSWLTPGQKKWNPDVMTKLLNISHLKSDSTYLKVIVNNNARQTIELAGIDYIFSIFRNKNIIVTKIKLDTLNLPGPGYHFFSKYKHIDEQIEQILNAKFKVYQKEHLGVAYSYYYKEMLDLKKVYFYIKRKNEGFAYQVRYNPQHLSKQQIEILFNDIQFHVLSDDAFDGIDIINLPIVISSDFPFEKPESARESPALFAR